RRALSSTRQQISTRVIVRVIGMPPGVGPIGFALSWVSHPTQRPVAWSGGNRFHGENGRPFILS
ncbi:MAG: hypothetical protein M3Y43_06965, partial [Pseudomonadota bacterium]|nr:hypothetical protein [Pseudomonadota bacterium]